MLWVIGGLLAAILIVLIALYVATGREKSLQAPMQDLANLRITDARVGDTISITGAGDNFEDLMLTVDRRDRYQSGRDEWFELSGHYKGQRVFLEVVEDDEVEVFLNRNERTPTVQELGLTEEDLIRLDEIQDQSAAVECNGDRWLFQESEEAGYFKNGRGEREGFYCWNFRDENGSRYLSIEKWEGEPFEVSIATAVNPEDVQVFRGG